MALCVFKYTNDILNLSFNTLNEIDGEQIFQCAHPIRILLIQHTAMLQCNTANYADFNGIQ